MTETAGDENILARAKELIDAASDQGLTLRLVGSAGFRVLAEDPELHADTFDREIGDIDLVGYADDSGEIQDLFEDRGYEIDKDILLAGWGNRLVFYGDDHEVDVFLDEIKMCHTIDLRGRLELGPNPYVVTPADLLLEKLQIVEINEKDLKDMTVLLRDYPITTDETGVNGEYIANLLSDDWGFWYTVTSNLTKLRGYVDRCPLEEDGRDRVRTRIDALEEEIEATSKSMKWKLRSKIGTRMQWYEEVEAKHH